MNKLLSILNRTVLVLGLLVALTPCGLCHGPAMSQTSTCPMAHMGVMKCCQGHQAHNPLCKIMDQSSLQVSGTHLNFVVIPVVSFTGVLPSAPRMAEIPPKIPFDTSPPKPLVLRI
jgi:hypothetical protein